MLANIQIELYLWTTFANTGVLQNYNKQVLNVIQTKGFIPSDTLLVFECLMP